MKKSTFEKRMPLLIGGWVLLTLCAGVGVYFLLLNVLNGGTPDTEVAADAPVGAEVANVAAEDTGAMAAGDAETVVEAEPTAMPDPTAEPVVEEEAAAEAEAEPEAVAEAEPEPAAEPTPLPPGAESGMGYGVQMQTAFYGDAAYWMDLANGLGINWVKHQVRWGAFGGTNGPEDEDWSQYDAFIEQATARDLKVMLSVVTAPEWSRTPEHTEGPPDDYQDFADYIGRMIDRYPGQIGAIEVWNEMNLLREWNDLDGQVSEEDPAQYVEMARVVSEVIRAKDPSIIIISGALSPTGVNNPSIAMDDFRYLQLMMDAGLEQYVDCIGVHTNGLNVPPEMAFEDAPTSPEAATWTFTGPATNPDHSWSMYSTITGYREIAPNLPQCITEFGYPSVDGLREDIATNLKQGFEFAVDNTKEEQADYIVRSFEMFRELGYVELTFLFNLNLYIVDDPEKSDNALWALLDSDGAPRDAYWAVAGMEKP